MSELAARRMTLDEFLIWDDGTGTRYELVDGVPLAMAPPGEVAMAEFHEGIAIAAADGS
jgi:Uma2 family endonuclease